MKLRFSVEAQVLFRKSRGNSVIMCILWWDRCLKKKRAKSHEQSLLVSQEEGQRESTPVYQLISKQGIKRVESLAQGTSPLHSPLSRRVSSMERRVDRWMTLVYGRLDAACHMTHKSRLDDKLLETPKFTDVLPSSSK